MELARESLRLVWELRDRQCTCRSLELLAALARLDGGAERAARLFGATEALRRAIGTVDPVGARLQDRDLAAARAELEEERFAALCADGRALSPDRAVAYALDSDPAGDPRTGEPLKPAGDPCPIGLTPREREVAALVARGFSNRQIGEALVITEGTANLHVKHILAKFGFTSRAQIAAWAARQGHSVGSVAAVSDDR